jgi:microcystin degradation protein MlrC
MTTGGAPGDGTALLRELLNRDIAGKAMLTVVDPEAVGQVIPAGVGHEVTLAVGGKLDTIRNRPVTVTGRVKAITDGRYVSSIGQAQTPISMGRTVVLEVGDIFVVLCEMVGPNLDPALYRSVGLEPKDAKIVVVKSAYSFRDGYEAIAREIIMVNSPGVSSPDLRAMKDCFTLAPRPLFPLDDDVSLTF